MNEFDINRLDNFNLETPSETFISSIQDKGGQSDVKCDCGKRHIAYMNCGHDEEYFEYVDVEAKLDPSIEVHYDDDFIYCAFIAGRTFVIGCDCNGLKNYENFIWETRNTIRSYLKHRVMLEKQWADEEELLEKLSTTYEKNS